MIGNSKTNPIKTNKVVKVAKYESSVNWFSTRALT